MGKKRDCKRLHPYVERALAKRLEIYVAFRGLQESAVVETATQRHLDDEESTTTRILARIDRIGRAHERLHRDVEILSEAFAIFVQLWFAYAPSLDADGKDLARRTAASRYAQFVEEVAHQYQSGKGLLHELAALRFDAGANAATPAHPTPTPTETGPRGGKP